MPDKHDMIIFWVLVTCALLFLFEMSYIWIWYGK